MDEITFSSFASELEKMVCRHIAELLTSKATRAGLNPDELPSIRQVGFTAARGDRPRAAAIARNVRSYLSSNKLKKAAA